MLKKLFLLLPLFTLVFALGACGNGDDDEVVAIVNDREIYESEMETSVNQMVAQYEQFGLDMDTEEGQMFLVQIKKQALENLIEREVLLQAAQAEGYGVSDDELEQQIEQNKAQFPDEESFQEALEDSGFTLDSYKQTLEAELSISRYFEAKIDDKEVSEEDIEAFYDEYVESIKAENEDLDEDEQHEIPELDELDEQIDIEQQLIEEYRQEQIQDIIEDLMADADIERLTDFEVTGEEE